MGRFHTTQRSCESSTGILLEAGGFWIQVHIWAVTNRESRQSKAIEDPLTERVQPDYPESAPFLVSRLGGGGLPYGQTRNDRFVSPARGMRIQRSGRDDIEAVCQGLQLLLPKEAAFVCCTAALLHSIPLPPWIVPQRFLPVVVQQFRDHDQSRRDSEDFLVDVAYPPSVARRQIKGVRHRQWRPDPSGVTSVGGLRVSSPARTWMDLAALIPPDYLLAAGDHIVRYSSAQIAGLRQVVQWADRRRGVRNARSILEMINPGAESPPESRVRYWLHQYGLPDPEVNADIVVRGSWLARGDLVFRDRMVVVEYDGVVHLAEDRRRYDAKRRNLLQEHGWRVVVLTADDLLRPYAMAQTVLAALARSTPTRPFR